MNSEEPLSNFARLHFEKLNPLSIDQEVEHYSIPSWSEGTPERCHSSEIQSTKFLLPDCESILVSRLNPEVHKVWRVEENHSNIIRLASTEWAVVIPLDAGEIDFINCAVDDPSFQHQLEAYVTGTTSSHKRVRSTDFLKLLVPCPSRENRKNVGEIYALIQQYKMHNLATVSNIEDLISKIYQSWFVDYEPMLNNTTSKLYNGKNRGIVELFPESFENTKYGRVPTGWVWKKLGECCRTIGGTTPPTSVQEFWDGEHCWTSPKDLSGAKSPIMLDTERKITDAGLAKISSGLLPLNSVLMSSRAPIGYLSLTRIPVAINQGYIAITPESNLSPYFMMSWIKHNLPLIEAYSSGTTFAEISKREFRKIPILVPSDELIEKFNETVAPLYDLLETKTKGFNQHQHLIHSLMSRLLSGQIVADSARS